MKSTPLRPPFDPRLRPLREIMGKPAEYERLVAARLAELRADPEARAWGGLRREAESLVDADLQAIKKRTDP